MTVHPGMYEGPISFIGGPQDGLEVHAKVIVGFILGPSIRVGEVLMIAEYLLDDYGQAVYTGECHYVGAEPVEEK